MSSNYHSINPTLPSPTPEESHNASKLQLLISRRPKPLLFLAVSSAFVLLVSLYSLLPSSSSLSPPFSSAEQQQFLSAPPPANANDSPAFDLPAALMQLQFSKFVVCGVENLESLNFEDDLKAFKISHSFKTEATDVEGFVGFFSDDVARRNIKRGDIQLVYRGSKSVQNYAADVLASKNPSTLCNECMVHSGFEMDFRSVIDEVKDAIEKLKSEGRRSWFSGPSPATLRIAGHSLGGALAAMTALDISTDPRFDKIVGGVEVTTFGEPRVGNAAFAEAFSENKHRIKKMIRIVNKGDSLVHLPWSSYGFVHEGREVWTNSKGENFVCDPPSPDTESPGCSNSVIPLWLNLRDHSEAFSQTIACPQKFPARPSTPSE